MIDSYFHKSIINQLQELPIKLIRDQARAKRRKMVNWAPTVLRARLLRISWEVGVPFKAQTFSIGFLVQLSGMHTSSHIHQTSPKSTRDQTFSRFQFNKF